MFSHKVHVEKGIIFDFVHLPITVGKAARNVNKKVRSGVARININQHQPAFHVFNRLPGKRRASRRARSTRDSLRSEASYQRFVDPLLS